VSAPARGKAVARRVLLIEDESAARSALESLLREEGFEVRSAATGRQGLADAREFHPDTVLCDYFLPDIDGLEILRELRGGGHPLSFVAITAGGGGEGAQGALRREADHYLPKPLDLARLREILGHPANGTTGAARDDQNPTPT